MDCNEARLLVDERVQGVLSPEQDARLAGHLKDCADCRQDLAQLTRTRELLTDARRDAPPDGELARILLRVKADISNGHAKPKDRTMPAATSAPLPVFATTPRKSRARWKLVAVSSLIAAAMLLLCFNVGRMVSPGHENLVASGRWENAPGTMRTVGPAVPEPVPSQEPAAEEGLVANVTEYTETDLDSIAKEKAGEKAYDKRGALGYRNGGGSSSGGGGGRLDDAEGGKIYYYDQSAKQPDAPAPKALPVPVESKPVSKVEEGKKDSQGKFAAGEGEAPVDRPKIIKTGDLTVEVKSFSEASRQADALVVKYQGFVADSRTYDQPGGTRSGLIVIRVAPEKFEELYVELKKIGNVLNERAGGQDITAQYVDTEARIKNLQVAEERLQELIKSKTFLDKVESLLQVERELARVRGEIEGYQGQMRVWQNQISLSTIRLSLQEPQRAVPSGSLVVEIGSLADAKKSLDAALSNVGGQLVSGQISKRADGTLMGSYTLRVNFGRFGELVGSIKDLGRTEDERIVNQPFGGAIPAGAEGVPCELALQLYEHAVRLPSGNLNLEVPSMSDALGNLKAALAASEGSIVNNQTQRQPNGATTANITLRVKAGKFQGLMDALPSLGRVTNRLVNGESGQVQGGAAEVPCNIQLYLFEPVKEVPAGAMSIEVNKFTAGRDQLSALIKDKGLQVIASTSNQRPDGTWTGSFTIGIKADAMDAVVTDIEKFGIVKSRELTGLGLGDLSKVDPNVVGQVRITLSEPLTIAPQEDDAFRRMLRDTFGGFLASMGLIVRGAGAVLPWALIFGVFAWFVVRWQRKKEAAERAAAAAAAPKAPDAAPASAPTPDPKE